MAVEFSGDDVDGDLPTLGHDCGDLLGPEHAEVGRDHLRTRGEVEPDLKQFQIVGLILRDQGKHFGMLDPATSCEPLGIALPEPSGGAERIGVVDVSPTHHRDGFKAAVGMLGKARDCAAVVHRPALAVGEVRPQHPAHQWNRRTLEVVPGRVVVYVVDREYERVDADPRKPKVDDFQDGTAHGLVNPLRQESLPRVNLT